MSNPGRDIFARRETVMLKRLLKIALCILVLILVLGPIFGYWLRRSLNSSDLRTRYNFIYRFHIPTFNKEPNALLVETASKQKPGKALDIAMGEGRNAVWLASNKWEVTGFDVSDEGLAQANNRAQKAGVKTLTAKKRNSQKIFFVCFVV